MHIEDKSDFQSKRVAMTQAWSPTWMRRVLGLPELETFKYPPDCHSIAACYVDMIAGPTKTGYKYVYKVGKRFQAKLYVRPGVQRSLASCRSAEEAAVEIILLAYGMRPLPPSPVKDKPKICKPKRQRVKAQRALPTTPLAELPAQPPTPATFAAMGIYTAPCFEGEAPGAPIVVACGLESD